MAQAERAQLWVLGWVFSFPPISRGELRAEMKLFPGENSPISCRNPGLGEPPQEKVKVLPTWDSRTKARGTLSLRTAGEPREGPADDPKSGRRQLGPQQGRI